MAQSDSNKSGDISLAEFIHYVIEHEKKLRLQFSHLDKNKDGILIFFKINLLIKLYLQNFLRLNYYNNN